MACLRRRMAIFLIMCGDIAALSAAFILALLLRYEGSSFAGIYRDHVAHRLPGLLISFPLYIAIFGAFRLYRYAWRFASFDTLKAVVLGNLAGLAVLCCVSGLATGRALPLSVTVIFLMSSVALVGCVRMMLRLASLGSNYGGWTLRLLRGGLRPKRILILGSGATAARLIYGLRTEMQKPYRIVGMLDDSPAHRGLFIGGVEVLGPLSMLFSLLDSQAVDEVVIALRGLPGAEIRDYVMACRKCKVPVKTMPALQEALKNNPEVKLEDISVEDLLRRPIVCGNMDDVIRVITGKRVLVTGAGGSIGSELCRQILRLKPSRLVLLGHGENSIHRIHKELIQADPAAADVLSMAVASTADSYRIHQVFEEERPQIVFHAAAHKHVPIMETNLLEAILNNVIGTYNVAEACGRNGVGRMVLISTDKAVYPSCIMGATKRVCEETLRAMMPVFADTAYVTVRFGNVLGSRGSATRIFHEQILRGGPVTVTHSEMTRFFMSIPEASYLVLQAGAVGRSGELYLLEMGSPVKIVDLAHDMIRLCGYEPDVDVPVVFTGVRPGEKLHEQLTEDEESLMPASCSGMSVVRRKSYWTPYELFDLLRQMRQAVEQGDRKQALVLLDRTIPEGSSRLEPQLAALQTSSEAASPLRAAADSLSQTTTGLQTETGTTDILRAA